LTQVRSVNVLPEESIEIDFELPSKKRDFEESWKIVTISLERHKEMYGVCEI
jgi:hypothetical protein